MQRGGEVHVAMLEGEVVFIYEDFHITSTVFVATALAVSTSITAITDEGCIAVESLSVRDNVVFIEGVNINI